MSNVYILPSAGDTDEVVAILTKAGVTPHFPETIREFVLGTHNENLSVVFMKPSELIILQRNANTLIEVMPTVVMAVPGMLYTHEWSGIAATFPQMDWLEFKTKFRKSGSTAFDPASMTSRHAGFDSSTYAVTDEVVDDTAEGESV